MLRATITAIALVLAPCMASAFGEDPPGLNVFLERLALVYTEAIASADDAAVTLKDGTKLPVSDGRTNKSFDELLDAPDIGDMAAMAYPWGATPAPPAADFDPGRVRVEPLFRAIYGDCRKGDVAPRLRKIAWLPKRGGGSVRFTTSAGADKALEAVSRDLEKLPAARTKFLKPLSGTYNCRVIAGTNRMSMHAYGAAIDINTAHGAYWRWSKAGWSNKFPKDIIDIFERHGFIWGGRWHHYDTMHFEYRPDLLTRE